VGRCVRSLLELAEDSLVPLSLGIVQRRARRSFERNDAASKASCLIDDAVIPGLTPVCVPATSTRASKRARGLVGAPLIRAARISPVPGAEAIRLLEAARRRRLHASLQILKLYDAGVASTLPAASVARKRTVCQPLYRPV
jgi:hypothetical protein